MSGGGRIGKTHAAALAAALGFVPACVGLAADIEAGKRKGEVCVACHGPAGNSGSKIVEFRVSVEEGKPKIKAVVR